MQTTLPKRPYSTEATSSVVSSQERAEPGMAAPQAGALAGYVMDQAR